LFLSVRFVRSEYKDTIFLKIKQSLSFLGIRTEKKREIKRITKTIDSRLNAGEVEKRLIVFVLLWNILKSRIHGN